MENTKDNKATSYEQALGELNNQNADFDIVLDDNFGDLLTDALSGLEEWSSFFEDGKAVGKEGLNREIGEEEWMNEGNLGMTKESLETNKSLSFKEMNVEEMASNFYQAIDYAWSHSLPPWKFCLVVYQSRNNNYRYNNGRNDSIRSDILMSQEQYTLTCCLLQRISHISKGGSPLLFRFLREAMNVGYINLTNALKVMVCLVEYRKLGQSSLVKSELDWLFSEDAFASIMNSMMQVTLVGDYSCQLEWISFITDLLQNYRSDASLSKEETYRQRKLILYTTELLLNFILYPNQLLGEDIFNLDERPYLLNQCNHIRCRVASTMNDARVVALIRTCGRRDVSYCQVIKRLLEKIMTDAKPLFLLSKLYDGLDNYLSSEWDKNTPQESLESESFMKEICIMLQSHGYEEVASAMVKFWFREDAHAQENISIYYLSQVAKAAVIGKRRNQITTAIASSQLLKSHSNFFLNCITRWVFCKQKNNHKIRALWESFSTLQSLVESTMGKLYVYVYDDYSAMILAFILIFLFMVWMPSAKEEERQWLSQQLYQLITTGCCFRTGKGLEWKQTVFVMWILYFGIYSKLLSRNGSLYDITTAIQNALSIRQWQWTEWNIFHVLYYVVIDMFDDPKEEPNGLIWFTESWLRSKMDANPSGRNPGVFVLPKSSCYGWVTCQDESLPRDKLKNRKKLSPTAASRKQNNNDSLSTTPNNSSQTTHDNNDKKTDSSERWKDAVSSVQSLIERKRQGQSTIRKHQSVPSKPVTVYQVAPSDLTFLWEECHRCFYLKVHRKLFRPRLPFPSVFSAMDQQMKNFFSGKRTEQFWKDFPDAQGGGIFATLNSSCALWIESKPLEIVNEKPVYIILRGKIDSYLQLDDGSIGLIDFKTSQVGQRLSNLYSRQLHAYAWSLEYPAKEKSDNVYSISGKVRTMGLIGFQPRRFDAQIINPSSSVSEMFAAALEGSIQYFPIQRNDAAFIDLLTQVAQVLQQPQAPCLSKDTQCPYCQYILQQ
eukprot:jgi/Galph1/673/GphlegSOOS_G5365.1